MTTALREVKGMVGELGGILALDEAAEGQVDKDGREDGDLGPENGEFQERKEVYCGDAPL